ncbi:MAG: TerB family tellurite resistance protein [Bacteroidales bacterium]|nr:TerB family tellurite resistance protein [Bacteroidales bacterium]
MRKSKYFLLFFVIMSANLGYIVAGGRGIIFGAITGLVLYFWFTGRRSVRTMQNAVLEAITKLSLAVMKADKSITQSELIIFRNFMLSNFGSDIAGAAFNILQEYQSETIDIEETADILSHKLNEAEKLQILRFLFQIAAADGEFSKAELTVLMHISLEMEINQADFQYIKSSFDYLFSRQKYQSNYYSDNKTYSQSTTSYGLSADYALLGVQSTDNEQVIKEAYRRLAISNHPDKFQHLGETARKEAEKRFSAINAAYNRIKKARKEQNF